METKKNPSCPDCRSELTKRTDTLTGEIDYYCSKCDEQFGSGVIKNDEEDDDDSEGDLD